MEIVYVALGSNLDSPYKQILRAFTELETIENTELVAASSLYQTKPWGILDQADFINAVVKLKTTLSAQELFLALLAIEQMHQRVRKEKNGPRTLDCDLLLYGDEIIETDILTVPHPQMTNRSFVLVPLAEIAPGILLNGQAISTYLQGEQSIKKLVFSKEEITTL